MGVERTPNKSHHRNFTLEKKKNLLAVLVGDRTRNVLITSPSCHQLSYPDVVVVGKETWGFTSTETIQVYQGRGSFGGWEFYISNTSARYTVTTRMTLH